MLFVIPLGRLPISFCEFLNLSQLIIVYTIFLLFLFVCWLGIFSFREKHSLVKSNSLYLPLGLFLLWSALSFLWTVSIPATFTQISYFVFYLFAFFICFNTAGDDKSREKFLWVLLFSTFLVSIYAVHQYFWGLEQTRQYLLIYRAEAPITAHEDFMSRLYTDRAFSTFLYPNTLATFLMMVLPFAVFSAVFCDRENNVKRVIFSALSLLILFAFVLTFSKGGMLVLILSWLLFLLFKVPKSRRTIAAIAFIFLVAFVIFYVYNDKYVAEKVQPLKDSLEVRVEYWRAGLEMLKERPLTGFGLGSFGRVYAKYKLFNAEETQMAHNNFLQIWAELGIAGFLLFLSVFVFFFKQMNRKMKNFDNLSSIQKIFVCGGYLSVLSFILHSLGDFSLYVFSVTSVLFMIIGVSLGVNYEEKKIKNKKALFVPLFIVSVFVFVLLFRVFAAEGHYLEAMKKSKNINEAIEELKLSTRYWTFGEDEYRMGYHYLLSQMYKQKMIEERKDFSSEILRHLKQAVKHDKYRSFYWRELALMASLLRNDEDEAMEYIKRAVSFYPTLGYNYLVYGDVYMVFGKKEEAAKQYDMALKYDASLEEEINKRMRDLGEK